MIAIDVRIDAIYARQSVDRADSISIESQLEFCRYETRGAPYQEYTDKGYSGKNMDRPKFQEMLNDIRSGKIKRVICYKLDRCSRSILDFTTMIEEFQKYNVEFVSCTEKFDTSTPMGRAMLNICIVFAQLERETIQQRVTDAYHSRSVKGFYMGGRIPLGYKLEPYFLYGKKTSRYAIVPEQAEIVQRIYSVYSDPQASMGDVVKHLIDNGIKNPCSKDGHWNKARIGEIIKSTNYVKADLAVYNFFKSQGAQLHNPPEQYIGTNGCYLYSDKDGKRKTLCLAGHHVVLAPHPGIISSDIWLRCRKKCLGNKQVANPIKARNTWLAGKIKCGKCGYALVVKKAKTQTSRYFLCSRHQQDANACEGVGGIPAGPLENIVLEALEERMKEFRLLSPPNHTAAFSSINHLELKITQIQEEIERLLDKFSQANAVMMQYINDRISELDAQKKTYQAQLQDIAAQDKKQDAGIIPDYMSQWEKLTVSDKISVTDALIGAIRVTETDVKIEWKI